MKAKFVYFLSLSLVPALILGALPALAEQPTSEEVSIPEESARVEDYVPAPLQIDAAGREIFSSRRGYFHPFLAVGESYTDNLFNSEDDREHDFITVITPGIWVAVPASGQQPLQVTTLNTVPGGLEIDRFQAESRRRIQGYALYKALIENHDRFSSEDRVNQKGEGLLRVDFRGGLALEILDVWESDQDPYATGESGTEANEFTDNYFQALVDWSLTPKTEVRLDYSRFDLDFDSSRNAYRERTDQGAGLYLLHRTLPRTSFFLEGEFIAVDYDQDDVLQDSDEIHSYAGAEWNMTAKSRGRLKVGYGRKNFQGDDSDDSNDLIGEVRLDHRFTPKTSIYLRGLRKTTESDIADARDVLSHRLQAGYRQGLTPRLNSRIDAYFLRDDYRGGSDRKDDYYSAGLLLEYAFRGWLKIGAGYRYVNRDSNVEGFDYRTNTVFLNLTAAL